MKIIEIDGKFYRPTKKYEYWHEIGWYSADGFNEVRVKLVRIDVIDPEIKRIENENT